MPDAVASTTSTLLGELFGEARTAHVFTDDPVTDQQLMAIWDLYKWAPTTFNAQPMHVTWMRTKAGKARVLPYVWDGNHGPFLSAPVTAICSVDTRYHEQLALLFPYVPGLGQNLEEDLDHRWRSGALSAHMQAGYLVLAARAVGLAVGPMEGFNPAELDADLFPDGRYKSFELINLGYPAEGAYFDRGPRRPAEEVMSWM